MIPVINVLIIIRRILKKLNSRLKISDINAPNTDRTDNNISVIPITLIKDFKTEIKSGLNSLKYEKQNKINNTVKTKKRIEEKSNILFINLLSLAFMIKL